MQLVGEGEPVYPLDHFADFRPGLSRFEIAEQAFEHARGCAGGRDELDDAPFVAPVAVQRPAAFGLARVHADDSVARDGGAGQVQIRESCPKPFHLAFDLLGTQPVFLDLSNILWCKHACVC